MALEDLLPRVRQEHQRRIEVLDSPPLQAEGGNDHENGGTCSVCHKNQSRYTCPRCMIPYCSLACYRVHDGPKKASASDDGDELAGREIGYCTEAFSRDRVTNVVQLEAKEKRNATQRMLQKVYQSQQENDVDGQMIAGSSSIFQPNSQFSQEELLRILRVAEQGTPEELEELWMSSTVSHEMRQSLDHAIRSGHLQDWILEPWHPWWRPDFSPATGDENDDEHSETTTTTKKTLDERLLDAAPFHTLLPSTKTTALPDLRFNLVDILYSTILTLRVYHGATNALDNSFEAADTLIHASYVLSRDARWSSLEHVLTTMTWESGASTASDHGWPLAVLLEDVSLVCQSQRFVAKVLFEGLDIIKSGLKSKQFKGIQEGDQKKDAIKEKKTKWRRIAKKFEFYISWTKQEEEAPMQHLAGDIRRWISEWESSEADDGRPSARSDQQKDLGPPLISELITSK